MIQTVVGILRRNNRLLIAERPLGKPYSGFWEFPGGKIEKNESSESALKRELYEELGIEVTKAKAWITHHHSYPDKIVSLDVWLVSAFIGEPEGRENQQLRWVTVAELKNFHLLDGNLAIIEKLKQE